LIAPAYKWNALPNLIKSDPYLKGWNDTIFGNATEYANRPAVVYFLDGDSGILDNAREVKQRVKAFAYAYRMTNDTKWVDLTWRELQVRFLSFSCNVKLTANRTLPETLQIPSDLTMIDGTLNTSSTPQSSLLPTGLRTTGSTTS
jgi:hypothetical protein